MNSKNKKIMNNEEIIKDSYNVFNEVIERLNNNQDFSDISDHTIHNSSIFQDKISINTAISVYALNKIIKNHYIVFDKKEIISILKHIKKSLKIKNTDEFKYYIKRLFSWISKNDKMFGYYIQDVIDKAKLKKAYRMWEHGLSLSLTSELTGINKWELQNYIGNIRIIKNIEYKEDIDIKDRFKIAEEIFENP